MKLRRERERATLAAFAVQVALVTATPIWSADIAATEWVEALASVSHGGAMASRGMGVRPFYAADAYRFSDIDGDGEFEFITVENTESYPKRRIATISRWLTGGRRTIEWQTEPLSRTKLLVGDIDGDRLDELILFGQGTFRSPGETTLRVVDWHRGGYRVFESDRLSGRTGALLDVDGDGNKEIVLGRIREKIREAEGTDPITLTVVEFKEGFKTAFERALPHGVHALGGGDLDGDGRDEIVTEEASFDGDVRGQLSIYVVDPQLGIERRFGRNGYVNGVYFLRVFRAGGEPYLFVDSGGSRHAISVFRVASSPEGYELVAQRADQFEIFWEAIRTTLAYIPDGDVYVRLDEQMRPELVPAADFRAPALPFDLVR